LARTLTTLTNLTKLSWSGNLIPLQLILPALQDISICCQRPEALDRLTLLIQRSECYCNITSLCINAAHSRPDEVTTLLDHTPDLLSLTFHLIAPFATDAANAMLGALRGTAGGTGIAAKKLQHLTLHIKNQCLAENSVATMTSGQGNAGGTAAVTDRLNLDYPLLMDVVESRWRCRSRRDLDIDVERFSFRPSSGPDGNDLLRSSSASSSERRGRGSLGLESFTIIDEDLIMNPQELGGLSVFKKEGLDVEIQPAFLRRNIPGL
jgi:hypothetical protein